MASRQGGPGSDDAPGTGSTDRPNAPHAGATFPDRRSSRVGTTDPSGPALPERDLPDRDPDRRAERTSRTTDVGTRTAVDPPLRDPGLYALTDHFRERLGQPGRYVSTRTVGEAIRHGQLRWNRTDGWRFAVVEAGVRFVVVVSDTETRSPVVVTAWTEIADRETALASARWDATDVETIAVRSALSESDPAPIPDRLRPRDVGRPFVVGGHRLETEPGEPFVRCTECHRRFRSKEDLTARTCRSRPSGR